MTKYEPKTTDELRKLTAIYAQTAAQEARINSISSDLAHCEQCLAEALAADNNWQYSVGLLADECLAKDKQIAAALDTIDQAMELLRRWCGTDGHMAPDLMCRETEAFLARYDGKDGE